MKTNKQSNWRYKLAWVDFQLDGMSARERIKGIDKKILGKKSRKTINEQFMPIEDQNENNDISYK